MGKKEWKKIRHGIIIFVMAFFSAIPFVVYGKNIDSKETIRIGYIDAVLAQNPEEETAMLLRGKVKEADGKDEEAEEDYKLEIGRASCRERV